QVLVVRRLHRPAVRRAQDGPAVRNRVRDADARLRFGGRREPVVMIEAKAELDARVAGLDVVLDVTGDLRDRLLLRVGKRRTAARLASDRTAAGPDSRRQSTGP